MRGVSEGVSEARHHSLQASYHIADSVATGLEAPSATVVRCAILGPMSTQDIRRDLSKQDQTVEITTTGRKTGRPHRIEVRLHNVGGRLFITGGVGGPRDWYANMRAAPAFTIHLKGDVAADVEAEATPILDKAERRAIFVPLLENTGRPEQLEARMTSSPLVRVSVALDR